MGYFIDGYLQNCFLDPEEIAPEIDQARKAVDRGVRFLNDYFDEAWQEEIEPGRLAMDSCFECVFGQLFGSFWNGLEKTDADRPREAFDCHAIHSEALTIAWLEHLTDEQFEV